MWNIWKQGRRKTGELGELVNLRHVSTVGKFSRTLEREEILLPAFSFLFFFLPITSDFPSLYTPSVVSDISVYPDPHALISIMSYHIQ